MRRFAWRSLALLLFLRHGVAADQTLQADEAASARMYNQMAAMMASGSAPFLEAMAAFKHFSMGSFQTMVDAWRKHTAMDAGQIDTLSLWKQKQCNVSAEDVKKRCSCFDMFNMGEQFVNHTQIELKDYVRLRRRALLLHHPDKHRGGSTQAMSFLTECSVLFCGDEMCARPRTSEATRRTRQYIKDIRRAWSKCEKMAARAEGDANPGCFSVEVEVINEETFDSATKKKAPDVRGYKKANAQSGTYELLFAFLDNSASMEGERVAQGKRVLNRIFPSMQEAPTSVHLLGSGPSELFSSTTDFTKDDVDKFWQATGGGTYMWEYIYSVLSKYGKSHAMSKIRVLIVTDGYDNESPTPFKGPSGFIEMMNRLHAEDIHPEMHVYCVGNDACTGNGSGANPFRDLVLASGGVYASLPDGASPAEESGIVNGFADHFTAPPAERALLAAMAQEQWLQLVEGGAPVSNKDAEYAQALISRIGGRRPAKGPKVPQEEWTCVQQGGAQRCTPK